VEVQFRQIADHEVRAVLVQSRGPARAVDADDDLEGPLVCRGDAGGRLLDDRRLGGRCVQPLRRLQIQVCVRVFGHCRTWRVQTVHDHIEHACRSGPPEYFGAIGMYRYRRRTDAVAAKLADQRDRGAEGRQAVPANLSEEELLLAHRQAAKIVVRQRDVPGGQEVTHFQTWPSPHVPQVVRTQVERHERGFMHRRVRPQERVEHRLPRRCRGLVAVDDRIQAEDHRIDALSLISGHALAGHGAHR
jgi:hypothetical protein